MFDVAPTELLLVAIVALLVIGPKDLPKAMRLVGYWVGKARGVGRQFRSGFDAMVREAELAEMEKQWAEENARIMREHPPEPAALPAQAAALPAPDSGHVEHDPFAVEPGFVEHASAAPYFGEPAGQADDQPAPVMVEKPVVEPAVPDHAQPAPDKAPS